MTEHDTETLRLAVVYKAACEAVQVAWRALISQPETAYSSAAYELRGTYHLAVGKASAARQLLIAHVSGGVLEVGQ